jgi:hypothetical protein
METPHAHVGILYTLYRRARKDKSNHDIHFLYIPVDVEPKIFITGTFFISSPLYVEYPKTNPEIGLLS